MDEVFQNYNHYAEWLLNNWNRNSNLDSIIINKGLMKEKPICMNGQSYRQLTKSEFSELESLSFVLIPSLKPNNNEPKQH